MCGRYSFAIEDELIKERFGVTVRSAVYKARYNCAPTQDLAVISSADPLKLQFYRWGLIPSWSKEPAIGSKMINARSETILEKPSFRSAFKSRRCLVLADSFYEWSKSGIKLPYRILLKERGPFAMAGIWDTWNDPEGTSIHSFSILTTEANLLIHRLHDRMPVILDPKDENRWVGDSPVEELIPLLKPYPAEKMICYPISKRVNVPSNDSEEIWHEEGEKTLFDL